MANFEDNKLDLVLETDQAKEFDKLTDIVQNQVELKILNQVHIPIEGSKVVDIGCGTGNYTYRIAEKVGPNGQVIGIDPDKERIKIAREKWVRDNLKFVEADGESFPEGQYDLIFSRYAIHWIKNKQATFNRVFQNLRPGGQFAFLAVHSFSMEPDYGQEMCLLAGAECLEEVKKLWFFISAEEYKGIATTAGFTVNLIEEDYDIYTLPNANIFLSSWQGITDGKFDILKADPIKLQKFKQKYAGKPMVTKLPVIRVILTKN